MNTPKIILFGYMLLILIVSLIPGKSLHNIEILSQDKILHFIEYSILGVLSFKAFSDLKNSVFLVIFFGTSFGCLNELIQILIPGRTPSLYDSLANLLGVSCGTIYSSFNKKNIL
ncbi:MAG: VanZ family protein [Candidatus Neomarinimicrobiota bacterium]|tara:strand:- start:283 stop:627 length:345 start_codon:yes stop_codon:yes gene_type:complete